MADRGNRGTELLKGMAKKALLRAALPYLLPALAIILAILLLVGLIITIFVTICNTSGVSGFVFRNFVLDLPSGFCDNFKGFESLGGALDRGRDALCQSHAELARQNNTAYPIDDENGNDPELLALISCIEERVGNVGSVFTFDQMHGTCNYTRGVETCEFCSHSVNSCHYGGRTGRTGALAVDFGGVPGAGQEGEIGPEILQAARACGVDLRIGLNRSTCENGQGHAVACADRSADHIHISLEICDADNGPLRTE